MAQRNARVQQDKEKLHIDATQRVDSSGKSFGFGSISIRFKVQIFLDPLSDVVQNSRRLWLRRPREVKSHAGGETESQRSDKFQGIEGMKLGD